MTQTKPLTVGRAVVCLLLNVLVLPGAGTLTSGHPEYKRIGRLQFALSLTLLPFLVASALGVAGLGSELARAWISNFMVIVLLWSVWTGMKIIRDVKRGQVSA